MFSIVANFDASHRAMSLSAYTINPPISSTRSTRNSSGILRQRTWACYQRDAKDEYACEHSIEWDDNKKGELRFYCASNIFDCCGGWRRSTATNNRPRSFSANVYVDGKEWPRVEKTRPTTIGFYIVLKKSSPSRGITAQISISVLSTEYSAAISLLLLNDIYSYLTVLTFSARI